MQTDFAEALHQVCARGNVAVLLLWSRSFNALCKWFQTCFAARVNEERHRETTLTTIVWIHNAVSCTAEDPVCEVLDHVARVDHYLAL